MIKGPKLRLKAIAPSMAQKTLRELRTLDGKMCHNCFSLKFYDEIFSDSGGNGEHVYILNIVT